MSENFQIARGDMAGLLAWVTIATKKLDQAKPHLYRYESPTTGKVQEVLCAWDEQSIQHVRLFLLKDKETGELVLGDNGEPIRVRYVKISKKPLTTYDQAKKLLGMFPGVLGLWDGQDGVQVLIKILKSIRTNERKPIEASFYDQSVHDRRHTRKAQQKAEKDQEREELRALANSHMIRQYIQNIL